MEVANCQSTARIPSYTFGERVLRTIYYEMAVAEGCFESFLIQLYKYCAKRDCSPFFDPKREAVGIKSLQDGLGASLETVIPRDGLASIQMMRLSSQRLEEKVKHLGGAWKRIRVQGSEHSLLAITPPSAPTQEWHDFEQHLLRLDWPKREEILESGTRETIIVTCENANAIDDSDFHTLLFLHSNSAGVTFNMLTKRWGFYLGCKQSICGYNPRGVSGSAGTASEAGHYNDIIAVYDSIKETHDPSKIWLSSACAGGPAAAYLTKQHPELTHWIFENGFTRLSDCMALQSRFAQWLASAWMGGLRSQDISDEHKPQETGYDIEVHYEGVQQTPGTVVVVRMLNDQVLSQEIYDRNLALAKRVHTRALEVAFLSGREDGNHHIARYFTDPAASEKMRRIIFKEGK